MLRWPWRNEIVRDRARGAPHGPAGITAESLEPRKNGRTQRKASRIRCRGSYGGTRCHVSNFQQNSFYPITRAGLMGDVVSDDKRCWSRLHAVLAIPPGVAAAPERLPCLSWRGPQSPCPGCGEGRSQPVERMAVAMPLMVRCSDWRRAASASASHPSRVCRARRRRRRLTWM